MLPLHWLLLAALSSAVALLEGSPACFICLSVGGNEREDKQQTTMASACLSAGQGMNETARPVVQAFTALQPALEMIARLEMDSVSAPEGLEKCVTVSISPGYHLITAPVDMGNNSVVFVGGDAPPIVRCNTSEVDYERLFDPDYQDYSLRFVGSQQVSFVGVKFVSCPLPLRLERVRTVTIHNSTFQ